jgi:MraZ protein
MSLSFVGNYRHSLDSKNRVFIPSKYRDKLEDSFYITRNLNSRSLVIYSQDEWDRKSQKIEEIPDAEAEDIKDIFYTEAIDPTPDGQGRVTLSPALIEYAGINKNVVITGYGNHIQIWAEEAWEARQKAKETPERQDKTREVILKYKL